MANTVEGTRGDASGSASGNNTSSITTVTLGSVVMLMTVADSTSGPVNKTITGVTTSQIGGVAAIQGWTKILGFTDSAMGSGFGTTVELWMGTVKAVGACTITCAMSTSTTGSTMFIGHRQFKAGLGAATNWSVDGTPAGADVTTNSTTLAWAAQTAAAAGELLFAFVCPQNNGAAGSAVAGWTIEQDSFTSLLLYNLNAGPGSITPPSRTQSPTGHYVRMAVLLVASAGGPVALDGKAVAASHGKATMSADRPLDGKSTAAAGATATTAVARGLDAKSAAASGASADLTVVSAGWNGHADAASGARADVLVARPLDAKSTAASGGAGAMSRARPVDAVSAGSSGATGALSAGRAFAGVSAASSRATADLTVNEAPHPLPPNDDDLPPRAFGWRPSAPSTYRPPTIIYA